MFQSELTLLLDCSFSTLVESVYNWSFLMIYEINMLLVYHCIRLTMYSSLKTCNGFPSKKTKLPRSILEIGLNPVLFWILSKKKDNSRIVCLYAPSCLSSKSPHFIGLGIRLIISTHSYFRRNVWSCDSCSYRSVYGIL